MRTCFLVIAAAAAWIVSCHATYGPLEAADSCHCAIDHYCRIASTSPSSPPITACVPIPATCDPPSCSCLGRRVDACREELGRVWVFERRPVAACDECSREEYCLSVASRGAQSHACGLLPPQCEDDASCACIERTRRASDTIACADRSGHVELSVASAR